MLEGRGNFLGFVFKTHLTGHWAVFTAFYGIFLLVVFLLYVTGNTGTKGCRILNMLKKLWFTLILDYTFGLKTSHCCVCRTQNFLLECVK